MNLQPITYKLKISLTVVVGLGEEDDPADDSESEDSDDSHHIPPEIGPLF